MATGGRDEWVGAREMVVVVVVVVCMCVRARARVCGCPCATGGVQWTAHSTRGCERRACGAYGVVVPQLLWRRAAGVQQAPLTSRSMMDIIRVVWWTLAM